MKIRCKVVEIDKVPRLFSLCLKRNQGKETSAVQTSRSRQVAIQTSMESSHDSNFSCTSSTTEVEDTRNYAHTLPFYICNERQYFIFENLLFTFLN